MRVSISVLRAAANAIFDHLEGSGHSQVDLDQDYYWSIPDDRLYSAYQQPSDFTMGQLSTDWAEVCKIATAEAPPVAYALVWLSTLLRAVGTRVVS